MKTSFLIEDLQPAEANIIVERDASGERTKDLWLSGIFMQGDLKNRNGRVYPISEISKAVDAASQTIKENNGIFGELDHPQTLQINSDRISHVITEMKMVGPNAVGRAKIIPTPMGNIARTLIETGVKIGVSSRGTGNVNESFVSDFQFVTVDVVINPSAPGATPSSIYESLELNRHGRQVLTLAEQIQQDASAQKYFIESIIKFLSDINASKR